MATSSAGRFLVILPPEVGTAAFVPGMLISMTGEVAGKVVKPLDRNEYTYPLLVAKEIHIIGIPAGSRSMGGY